MTAAPVLIATPISASPHLLICAKNPGFPTPVIVATPLTRRLHLLTSKSQSIYLLLHPGHINRRYFGLLDMASTWKNKKRLYLVTHARTKVNDGIRRYHWSFLLAPKHEVADPLTHKDCRMYHASTFVGPAFAPWHFEAKDTTSGRQDDIVARLALGKVGPDKETELEKLLNDESRIRPEDPVFNSQVWVEEALADLLASEVIQTFAQKPIDIPDVIRVARQHSVEVQDRGWDVGHGIPRTYVYGESEYGSSLYRML